jgi:hypothetical protein
VTYDLHKRAAVISQYRVHWLVFGMQIYCVAFEMRTGFVNIIHMSFSLLSQNVLIACIKDSDASYIHHRIHCDPFHHRWHLIFANSCAVVLFLDNEKSALKRQKLGTCIGWDVSLIPYVYCLWTYRQIVSKMSDLSRHRRCYSPQSCSLQSVSFWTLRIEQARFH